MPDIKNILYTTDFSEYSKYALPYAVEMVEKFNGTLHCMYVVEPINAPVDFGWTQVNYAELEENHTEHAKKSLDSIIEEDVPAGIPTRSEVRLGRSFKEIIDYARENDIDMIVMATHGLSGLSHILFGSTTEKVVRKSPCPVLTIRHPEHEFEMP
ncbi:MAG: universal stress protein [Candidatus Marinimicrobia bacterium]|nr:universal stress protein [Candidatus Neomarinimicrobiota bacterium]MCF7828094.1 universal stress protein [Candidatus Neomarinimicrobiota bacterium]MCF7879731.1 universal stress protein [Candidatus Neomarinimicrobiota bacterium]